MTRLIGPIEITPTALQCTAGMKIKPSHEPITNAEIRPGNQNFFQPTWLHTYTY